MKLSDAIEGFLICKTGNRKGDLSPKTVRLYRHLLGKLNVHLGDPDISAVTSNNLIEFTSSLSSSELSAYAQDNYYKAIRSFWKWAVETLNVNPIHLDLRAPVINFQPIVPFSKSDIKRLLTGCESVTRTCRTSRKPYTQSRPAMLRDKALICLLLDTGLRIGEMSRLTLADVYMDANVLRVIPYYNGKKSRPREVPFGRISKRWLWQYISSAKPPENEPLFGLTVTGMTRVFARLQERTGVQDVHAHRFRHTFAIEYLRNGGDVFSLQYILGHSDLTMCRRYLVIVQADAQNAHAKASPVDNWL